MRVGGKSISAERRHARPLPHDVWVVSGRSNATSELLIGALHERGVGAQLVAPAELIDSARRGDTVLGRLDVRPTLDGVEDGLSDLRHLRSLPATTSCRRRSGSPGLASRTRQRATWTKRVPETGSPFLWWSSPASEAGDATCSAATQNASFADA